MKRKFYVKFDTAKMLAEKGYPQAYGISDYMYSYDPQFNPARRHFEKFDPRVQFYYAAPTYHEVLDWLEKKDILIDCTCGYDYNTKEQWYRCFTIKRGTRMQDWHTSQCPTREEALNAAILKALEMIQP